MRKSLMSDLAEVEREETARRKRAVMKRDVRGAPVLDRWRRERHLAALDAAFEEAFLPDVDLATQSPGEYLLLPNRLCGLWPCVVFYHC